MADPRIDEATGRYLPIIYPEELPFWRAAKARSLLLQECDECKHVRYPVGPVCPHCLSDQFSWKTMSGKGRVHNYVIYHKPWNDFLKGKVPYAVAQVEIAEGPRLTTNITGISAKEVRIGLPVEIDFEDITDEITLIQFTPVSE